MFDPINLEELSIKKQIIYDRDFSDFWRSIKPKLTLIQWEEHSQSSRECTIQSGHAWFVLLYDNLDSRFSVLFNYAQCMRKGFKEAFW